MISQSFKDKVSSKFYSDSEILSLLLEEIKGTPEESPVPLRSTGDSSADEGESKAKSKAESKAKPGQRRSAACEVECQT